MLVRVRDDEIIGKSVRVKECQAREHGNNEGCVCHLIGQTVQISHRYKTPYAGTPSYHIVGMDQRVRRSEVVLLKDQRSQDDTQKKRRLRELSPEELMVEYRTIVRLNWENRKSFQGRTGQSPTYQRELSMKREILRRLNEK